MRQPSSSLAFRGSATVSATSPARGATISYGTGLPEAASNARTTSSTLEPVPEPRL